MQTSNHSVIRIKGARQHNLRNLDIEIPRNQLVVVTGLSGSGKSSLAFDTLYAEGQRKYVESLSAYARQFLDKMQKPDVDYIEGLSPAIAIEQRTSGANPRSTIATTTEIYDYLRLLFAAVGLPHDPATGEPVVRQTPQQIADEIAGWPEGTKFMVLAPMVAGEVGEFRDVIEKARREGFVRLRIDGEMVELGTPDPVRLDKGKAHVIEAVVDRLTVREEMGQRLADSLATALRWGGNQIVVLRQGDDREWVAEKFSTDYCNPATGFTMAKLTPKHFSFNSHFGACRACHGIGTQRFCDPELMVDPAKTLRQGAIKPWKSVNKKMKAYYAALLEAMVRDYGVRDDVAFRELPEEFKAALFHGTGERKLAIKSGARTIEKAFEGLVPMLERLLEESESELTKNRLRAFTGWEVCSVCRGARLKPEILAVTIADGSGTEFSINEFCALSIGRALEVAGALKLKPAEAVVMADVLREVRQRLGFSAAKSGWGI